MSSPMLFLGGIVFALDVIVMIVEFPEMNVNKFLDSWIHCISAKLIPRVTVVRGRTLANTARQKWLDPRALKMRDSVNVMLLLMLICSFAWANVHIMSGGL